MPVRKRSVTISGHQTSYSLEDEFLDALRELADTEGLALAALIAMVDARRPRDASLSSALRLHVLAAARAGRLSLSSPGAADPAARS